MKKIQNTEFDITKITKIYKNQKEPINNKFTDELFLPNDNSLISNNKNSYINQIELNEIKKYINIEEIEWKRASEIFIKPTIFSSNNLHINNMKKSKIVTKYFQTTISSLINFPGLIEQIFLTKEYNEETSLIKMILFIDGEFQIIFLDDYFPVIKNTNIPYFTLNDNNDLWILLLEKAYAKINGCYGNIIFGWPDNLFKTLTGFSTEFLIHSNCSIENLWNVVFNVYQNKGLIVTFSKSNDDVELKGYSKNCGFVILYCLEIDNKKLCVIKNCFIEDDYIFKGEFSIENDFWTNENKNKIDNMNSINLNDKSLIWITIEDLHKYFLRTDICHLIFNGKVKNYEIKENLNLPKIYNLYIPKKCLISISILGDNILFHRENLNISQPTSLIIAEYDPSLLLIKEIYGNYNSNGESMKTINLNPGYYLIWAYRTIDYSLFENNNSNYKIRFICNVNYSIKEIGNDNNFLILSEIIYNGIRYYSKDKINESSNKVYYESGNSFHNSGISYYVGINKVGTLYQIINCDCKEIKNLILLPPYNNNDGIINCKLAPYNYFSILAIQKNLNEITYFKMNIEGKEFQCREGEKLCEDKERINFESFCMKDIEKINIEYDYETSSENILKQINIANKNYINDYINKLKEKYPIIIKEINKLKKENENENLKIIKFENENGIYIGEGELNIKKGRGGFIFKNNEIKNYYWIGYWENNKREKYGKFFNDKGKLIYEGDYKNDLKNGEGIYYYNNGDKYEGEWVNGIREGKGIFYWKNGDKWEGYFHNDLLDGEGMFYNDVDSFPVVYKKGENVS